MMVGDQKVMNLQGFEYRSHGSPAQTIFPSVSCWIEEDSHRVFDDGLS
jgi:hypothetical protein